MFPVPILFRKALKVFCIIVFLIPAAECTNAQLVWNKNGSGFFDHENGDLVQVSLPGMSADKILPKEKLIPPGQTHPLAVQSFAMSGDNGQVLLFTNTQRVWRYKTRGDYWVYRFSNGTLRKLGGSLPASSLMFAKFSPDGRKVAYVSGHNLYVEDLETHTITPLTKDGKRQLINGTFDWVYEEEFFCRDGFRWSPDSRKIAFWQVDARNTKDYLMINKTDSIYPSIKPVEYPVAGELPSPVRIGVIDVSGGPIHVHWMRIPYDSVLGSYVPRMEWADNSEELIIQHLNRKQNLSRIMLCDVADGVPHTIFSESDSAWIDILPLWDEKYQWGGWDWLRGGREFLWPGEGDGWRHLYRISRDGKSVTLVTPGNFDVMEIVRIDEPDNQLYFMASPDNATQKYLFRTRLDGKGTPERISPMNERGTHNYELSPDAKYAYHRFSNYYTEEASEWVRIPEHDNLGAEKPVQSALARADSSASGLRFFKVKTKEGIEMDAWVLKPQAFDSTKKYPVLFYVYTEPWGQNVRDEFGIAKNDLYKGDLSKDGYIYITIDNRGTPVPKGRLWRKSVYRKIGLVNIRDQALAAEEILKWPFVDTSRIAVWGWSGGGSATLNLLFQYPAIYKTGIAIAAVANQLTYDNIYQERYMGLPAENMDDFIRGSPITYARYLKGDLLYIHGTGDDNVHYNNAEMLLNELIRYNKQIQFMSYPNRSHGIFEREGTREHLGSLYTQYLRSHCPPGPK
jgi:dipeptidyl-peptidase-4